MSEFEHNLWRRLVERHGAALASDRSPGDTRPRRAWRRIVARTTLAVAGVGFASAVVLIPPAVSGRTAGGGGAGNSGSALAGANSGITPQPTTLTALHATIHLRTVTFEAILKVTGGGPVAGEQIVFTVKGRTACTATTNFEGEAKCSVRFVIPRGVDDYTARFAGDTQYDPSSAIGKL